MITSSSWGGAANSYSQGKYRSIVDGLGPGYFKFRATVTNQYGTGAGTSVAAPTVAGMSLLFRDHYRSDISEFINDPGVLFTWMLNMGDRWAAAPTFGLASGFFSRSGAGKIRMRMINGRGMDFPWYWYSGWTCIDEGDVRLLEFRNSSPLQSSTDRLRVSIWWYDRRIENGTRIDDIDLVVLYGGNQLKVSASPYDNKERVWLRDVGGDPLKVYITGEKVTSDNEGCDDNSMKVFYSVMVEDDSRNDSNGPPQSVNCGPVAPL